MVTMTCKRICAANRVTVVQKAKLVWWSIVGLTVLEALIICGQALSSADASFTIVVQLSIKLLNLFLLVASSTFEIGHAVNGLRTNSFDFNKWLREGIVICVQLQMSVCLFADWYLVWLWMAAYCGCLDDGVSNEWELRFGVTDNPRDYASRVYSDVYFKIFTIFEIHWLNKIHNLHSKVSCSHRVMPVEQSCFNLFLCWF